MAYIQQVPVEQATGPTEKLYKTAQDRAGGVANIIRVMSQDGISAACGHARTRRRVGWGGP